MSPFSIFNAGMDFSVVAKTVTFGNQFSQMTYSTNTRTHAKKIVS